MKAALIGLSLFGFMPMAQAEEVNISEIVKNTLFKFNPILQIPGAAIRAPDGLGCAPDTTLRGMEPHFASMFRCRITFKNAHDTNIDVTYGPPTPAAIPTTITQDTYPFKNCKLVKLPIDQTPELSYTVGSTITASTTVTQGGSSTLTKSLTIPIKAIQFGITDVQVLSFSDSSTNTQVVNLTTTKKEPFHLFFDVDPMTLVTTVLTRKLSNGYIDVIGRLRLEADVFFSLTAYDTGKVTSEEFNVGKLSNFIKSDEDRTVIVHGQVWNVTASTISRADYTIGLTGTKLCDDQPPASLAAELTKSTIASTALRLLSEKARLKGNVQQ